MARDDREMSRHERQVGRAHIRRPLQRTRENECAGACTPAAPPLATPVRAFLTLPSIDFLTLPPPPPGTVDQAPRVALFLGARSDGREAVAAQGRNQRKAAPAELATRYGTRQNKMQPAVQNSAGTVQFYRRMHPPR
jgi:hypothetical protein